MTNEETIKKWLAGELTGDELQKFESDPQNADLLRMGKTLKSFQAPSYDPESELQKFNSTRKEPARGRSVPMFFKSQILKIAAAVLIGAALVYIILPGNSIVSVETTAGMHKTLFLPDSTRVILNALSSLQYDEQGWESNRNVNLEGEAFFDVKKGSTFAVATSAGRVHVLGTQFNIKDRRNFYEVICYEGKVRVDLNNVSSALVAGQSLRVMGGISHREDEIAESVPGWTTNESTFASLPYNMVVDEFERQYGVSVTLNNVDSTQLFTGSFAHGDIKLALNAISVPFGLNYTFINDNQIVLSGDSQ